MAPPPDPDDAKHQAWIRHLVATYENALQAYFTECADDEHRAEEWTSDLFTALWQHRAEYSTFDEGRMKGTVWAAARNRAIDEARKRKTARKEPKERTFERQVEGKPRVSNDPPSPLLGEPTEEELLRLELGKALEQLSAHERRILELTSVAGKTPKEIALELGGTTTEAAVNSALYTARKKVQRFLRKRREP